MSPKYNIKVKLSGKDGNIFNLLGIVRNSLKKNKVEDKIISEMTEKVFSSKSYEEALSILNQYVNIY